MKSLKNFYEGGYAKYILPGVLLQSVLIGGGYATGREIYSYGAKFGALGWISGLTIGIGFALFAFLTFEICRIYKVYDYKNYIKQVIGPLWPVMDILTVLIAIVLIAVMAAATGSIFEQVGLPNILGSVVIVFLCGLLNFKGSKVIEKFESVGTVLLYGGYILFTIIVLVKKGGNIPQVFAAMDTSAVSGSVTLPLCIWTGILYVAYNINAIPMGMFSLTRQTKRKETLVSGIIAGLLMVIPWFLSYFAMMCFYGDTSIVGADVATPWMEMIKAVNGGPVLLGLFSIVMGWTLVETATGCIHMIIDRFDVALAERGNAKMSDSKRGLITVATLIAALLLSRIGVVTLIEKGYSYLSYGFILFYLLPTLIIGGYKIIRHKEKKQ
ncbi:YkvI family membrane protein [Eisenbergiella sp.]